MPGSAWRPISAIPRPRPRKRRPPAALSGDALRKAESLSTDYIDRYGKPPGERN